MSYFVDKFGDTYKVIRNYIPADEAKRLGENYKTFVSTDGILTQDDKVKLAYDYYNRPEQAALLSEKVSEINTIFDEKVIPSFSYTRQYVKGSSLKKHVDRDDWDVSFNVHLCGDKEWALNIEDKEGKTVEIILQSGDAIIYDAHNAIHWREEYTGEFYINTFHYYVILGGDNETRLFDNNYDEESLSTYIKHYKSEVDPDICDSIIKYVEDYPDRWSPSLVGTGILSEGRICDEWVVNEYDEIDSVIYNIINDVSQKYTSMFPHLKVQNDNGYCILRYQVGGKYEYHTDQALDYNREISIILNLNDEYEGGKLTFNCQYMSKMLGKGDVIMFPSNFMYPHRINPVTSGVRYSIVTWMV